MELKEATSPDATDALATFLVRQKEQYLDAVKDGTAGEWTVVMGNEAGDLDSLASAIAYAYYANAAQPTQAPAVPLVQTPRADLHLRAENLYALALAGLEPSQLLCVSDLPAPLPSTSTRFALVDHNRLAHEYARPGARVVAVVDHHADEGLYADTASPRVVAVRTGSCASLVARLLQAARVPVPRELATLLLCSILIDTGGLRPGGKADDTDRAAATFLAPLSTLAPAQAQAQVQAAHSVSPETLHAAPAIRALNDTLQTKKASVAHLSTRDLLRRDYKEYTWTRASAGVGQPVRVGLASVPLGLRAWFAREPHGAFGAAARAWMDARGLDVLGVLMSFRDADHPEKAKRAKRRREQLYVVRDPHLADRLFAGLEASEELRLKRRKWAKFGVGEEDVGFGEGDGCVVGVWKQKNVEATRKATAPLVKSIIEGDGKGANL